MKSYLFVNYHFSHAYLYNISKNLYSDFGHFFAVFWTLYFFLSVYASYWKIPNASPRTTGPDYFARIPMLGTSALQAYCKEKWKRTDFSDNFPPLVPFVFKILRLFALCLLHYFKIVQAKPFGCFMCFCQIKHNSMFSVPWPSADWPPVDQLFGSCISHGFL